MLVFDDLYIQRWELAVSRCKGSLERHDLRQLEDTQDPAAANAEIRSLQHDHPNNAATPELIMLAPSFAQLEIFSATFVEALDRRVNVSILWGLLLLCLKLAIQSEDAVFRVARMLKVMGHKAELFNGYSKHATAVSQIKEVSLDAHIELLTYLTEVVKFFRGDAIDFSDDESWRPLIRQYKVAIQGIDEAFERVERLAHMAKTQTHMDELTKLQSLLSHRPDASQEEAKLPCYLLPTVRIARFYNRDSVIELIDEHFHATPDDSAEIRSIALYGLGGVGKSQTALKYAYRKKEVLDAILWIHSETSTAIAQSFTNAAIALKLPDAKKQHHIENRVLVLSWLQQTSARWLIVFDNAEDANLLLEYWPIASRGSILITARNPSFAFDPAETGIEIPHFSPQEGSDFLLHLMKVDISKRIAASEAKSALELSSMLSGHALALTQMAGLIHRRSWSISDFTKMYEENAQKMHTSSSSKMNLDTVWKLSFESLDSSASALLGVLSLLMPDDIPQSIFEATPENGLPGSLAFCSDRITFSEVAETLLTLSLIKRDRETGHLSIHRLVQKQFRYHTNTTDNQRSFENAAKLLDSVFPPKPKLSGQMYNVWDKCRKYLQHVLSLAESYKKDSLGPDGLRPTFPFIRLLSHCSRYLLEIGSYIDLANVLDIVHGAYNAWEGRQQNPMLLTTILLPIGTMWLHRGDFERSEQCFTEQIEITRKYAPGDTDALISPYNNIGNATASANKYDEAVIWYERLAEIEKVDDNLAPDALTQLNLGRALWNKGKLADALNCYQYALENLERSENWAMLAFTHFAYGNLYRKAGNPQKARNSFEKAKKIWTDHDNAPTHVFHGACVYKLGCIALDTGEVDEAIVHLEKALAIAQAWKGQLTGDYARTLWKISVALDSRPQNQSSDDGRAEEATILLNGLPGRVNTAIRSDEAAYDNLICCLWR